MFDEERWTVDLDKLSTTKRAKVERQLEVIKAAAGAAAWARAELDRALRDQGRYYRRPGRLLKVSPDAFVG